MLYRKWLQHIYVIVMRVVVIKHVQTRLNENSQIKYIELKNRIATLLDSVWIGKMISKIREIYLL